ncbi:glycerate kinase [Bacillus sp. B15-48]|uniref:glycerate kinase type-2 family protein n=1 Tax=Bacillus sp. B15-48 TaxID=1548601 RepID=UPI00193F065B|nr:glycerate kinase [Bacillus sp. B15-48]MBM4761331.1 DUF4147 domain-containing protein [Bacillus sp. B15-48]
MRLRDDAIDIIKKSIQEVLPDNAVKKALKQEDIKGNVHVIAIGKAAWRMAQAAVEMLGNQFMGGMVLTKYGHSLGQIDKMEILEAGHPVPDQQTLEGTEKILEYVESIPEHEAIVFLISGGGSSLFEKPLLNNSIEELESVNVQLLRSGANIVEMNTVRKHLSAVKGGRFAQVCYPRAIYSIILSDVLGNRVDTIASGPTCPDTSTVEEALKIVEKYQLTLSETSLQAITIETPKSLENVKTIMIGSVEILCQEAEKIARSLGFHTKLLSSSIEDEASLVGKDFGELAKRIVAGQEDIPLPCAIIAGGETVVTIKGNGKGGRNQELALSAAFPISGLGDVVFLSVGSDGTDGPTDAAGGMVDGGSLSRMQESGSDIQSLLENNDSYHALKSSGDLIFTGPTGTNVNDLMMLLIDKK